MERRGWPSISRQQRLQLRSPAPSSQPGVLQDGYLGRGSVQGLIASGLVYSIDISISKPGAYQLRAAVGDAGSDLLGSATTFVQVPDSTAPHSRFRVFCFRTPTPHATRHSKTPECSAQAARSPAFSHPARPSITIVRSSGAHPEKSSGKPRIEIEVHLFRGPERI